MRELCATAYQDAELLKLTENRAECDLEKLVAQVDSDKSGEDKRIWVASRNRPASLFMDPAVFHSHPEVGFVWMLRNPLDVLTSAHKKRKGYYVEPYRLIASLNLWLQFRNEPNVLTVRYEDLVTTPVAVQDQIAQRFGLQSIRPFLECHQHFPQFKQNLEALHSIRPIDANSVDKWKKNPESCRYLADVLKRYPEIIALGKLCGGYDIDRNTVLAKAASPEKPKPLARLYAIFTPSSSTRGSGSSQDDE